MCVLVLRSILCLSLYSQRLRQILMFNTLFSTSQYVNLTYSNLKLTKNDIKLIQNLLSIVIKRCLSCSPLKIQYD